MGKAIRASALMLLLACSASAGIMQYDAAPPSPPQSDGIIQYEAAPPPPPQKDGIIQYDAAPLLVQIALNLLPLL